MSILGNILMGGSSGGGGGSGTPEGTDVLSTGEAGAVKFLREDGDDTSSWQLVPADEGTAVKSTGEVGGTKFLREDGDDSSSWQLIDLTSLDADFSDFTALGNGMALDSPAVTVTSDGATITASIEKNGGGDIRVLFSTGVYDYDTTPADTVTLAAGSDTSPQINFVYMLESTKVLTASTASFPAAEHMPVATVLCQSAASLQTDGPYKMHAWTDHSRSSDDMGHLAHLNHWIRHQPATWTTGVGCTPTGGASNFDIATASGVVLQLHDHAYPAFNTATGSDIYVVNNSATAYNKVTDLFTETNDSTGSALDAWYTVVIWGAVNEAASDCKLFCNLPSGSYNNNNGSKATNDDEGYNVYTIPSDFTGVGFLIAAVTVSKSGSTITIQQTEDLRGQFPSQVAGGGATGGNEFADNVFRVQDNGDATKQIALEASGITTGNTRTITMPDSDVTLIENSTYNNSNWDTAYGWGDHASGGYLTAVNLVDDTTPQLGGDLDVNGKEIQSAGDVVFQLGDAAGANKLSVQDSGGVEAASIDSDGKITTPFIDTPSQLAFRVSNVNSYAYNAAAFYSVSATKTLGTASKVWGNLYSTKVTVGGDAILERDAANTLALRNSTNAQTFNIFSSYVDSSNYSRIGYSGTGITSEAAGTGTQQNLTIDAPQVVLPQSDSTTAPTLAFGDGDTGIYEQADDILYFTCGGVNQMYIHPSWGLVVGGCRVSNESTSDVTPVFRPRSVDTDTGVGSANGDQLSLIAGGVEGIRVTEDSGAITVAVTDAMTVDSSKVLTSANNPIVLSIAASDETTDLETGTGAAEFQMVNGAFTLTAVYATVTTAPTGSTIIVDINDGGTSIMTTNKISIDASEKTSDTAATQPTLTDTALAENAVITIDIDQIGSSTAGAGLKVYLVGYWT